MLDKSFPAFLKPFSSKQFFEQEYSLIVGRRIFFKVIGTTIKLLLPTNYIILIYCKVKEYSHVQFSSY